MSSETETGFEPEGAENFVAPNTSKENEVPVERQKNNINTERLDKCFEQVEKLLGELQKSGEVKFFEQQMHDDQKIDGGEGRWYYEINDAQSNETLSGNFLHEKQSNVPDTTDIISFGIKSYKTETQKDRINLSNNEMTGSLYMHAFINQSDPDKNVYFITLPDEGNRKAEHGGVFITKRRDLGWLNSAYDNLISNIQRTEVSDKEELKTPDQVSETVINDVYKRMQDWLGTIERITRAE